MCYIYFFLTSAASFKVISLAWNFLSAYLTSNHYSNCSSSHLFLWCFQDQTNRFCLFSSRGRLVGHVGRWSGVWEKWIVPFGVFFLTTPTLNNFHFCGRNDVIYLYNILMYHFYPMYIYGMVIDEIYTVMIGIWLQQFENILYWELILH